MRLGDVGKFYGGLSGKSKSDFTNGNETFISYMNVYSHNEVVIDTDDKVRIGEKEKQNTVQYGDVLFTGSSESREECGLSSVVTTRTDKKLYLNSFCFGYRFDEPNDFFPGFTKHLFRSSELRGQIIRTANGVTRFNVSKKKMESITISVPSLEKQKKIARVLDQFDALCHDLTAGLPAEIAGRQRQYGYYRDKLLSFAEKGSQ
ncbi:MAG: restriction endonuclease subunit S [Dialister sp.]|nr:restriction endonuclease subunit S [Dialister sp.]